MADIPYLEKIASQVRRDIVRMVHSAQSGHPGGSLGCTDFFVSMFFDVMELKPEFDMDGIEEDIFFLSNGHISPVFYSVLSRKNYFPIEELSTFRKINSRLQGHPATKTGLPGVRMASGSLGQGLSVACGAAIAKKQNKDPHFVFSLHGDGEMQEGQSWEAAFFAAHYKLDNLIMTIDNNNAQIDGAVDEIMAVGDLGKKFGAFGFDVFHLEGHDIPMIIETLNKAKSLHGNSKPKCIVMNTIMGKGVDYMMTGHQWHGIAPNDEQLETALAQLEETLGDY